MQAGLVNTYQHPVSNRSWVAWVLSGVLLVAYVLLYFGPIPALGIRVDLLQSLADSLGGALGLPGFLRSKWFLYGTLYTGAMIVGGLCVLKRHGNSRYQRIRTYSVVGVQVVMAFLLPSVLQVFGQKEYYFSYFWPLKIEYFYPAVILKQPFLIVLWSFLGSLVAFPLLGNFLGKRFYCSWVCGCGGLASTFGEPWRHLSSKSTRAWTIEKLSIHTVLFLAFVTTAIVWLNWAIGKQLKLETKPDRFKGGTPIRVFAVDLQRPRPSRRDRRGDEVASSIVRTPRTPAASTGGTRRSGCGP